MVKNMFRIGCHLSSSKGFLAMGKTAVEIGANTFQFFTRNPRGGAAKPLDLKDIKEFLIFSKENKIYPPLAHAPYTLNACAKEERVREFTVQAMQDDLSRLAHIPGCMYNFHPGSHVGQGEQVGIEHIAEVLNHIISPGQETIILLETMAGKGTEIGRNFGQIQAVIEKVRQKESIGVCLDTCHVYDGGYDIVNDLDSVLKEFDTTIGLEKLKAIHLNGTKNTLGSHKDRHEILGQGEITIDAVERIINHPSLKNTPFYLETPNELAGYAKEIEILKKLRD